MGGQFNAVKMEHQQTRHLISPRFMLVIFVIFCMFARQLLPCAIADFLGKNHDGVPHATSFRYSGCNAPLTEPRSTRFHRRDTSVCILTLMKTKIEHYSRPTPPKTQREVSVQEKHISKLVPDVTRAEPLAARNSFMPRYHTAT